MKKYSLFLAVFTLIVSACGTAPVRFTVKRPAKVNLKGQKQIALGKFEGKDKSHVRLLENKVTQHLIDSGHFESILDRKHMNEILEEHRLILSGVVNDTGIVELGNFIGAAAMIFATIDVDKYNESLFKQEFTITNKVKTKQVDKYGKAIYTNTYKNVKEVVRKGELTITVTFQMVDVETAQLITSKTLTASQTIQKKAPKGQPEMIDPEVLAPSLIQQVSYRFVSMLVPSYASVQAKFEKDRELPEVELAINKIHAGLWEDAIDLFKKMTDRTELKPVQQAKTWYNLGLAQGFYGEYEESYKNVGKAMNLNPKNKLYPQTIKQIRNEEKQAAILKSQQ